MAVDKGLLVLIVDDIASMLATLRAFLDQLGFRNVEQASDGAAALAIARKTRPGLIISDWNMEPMDGLALLKAVRDDAALKGTPFIMVSAEVRTEQLIAAKQAGVDNFIVKPFDAETLRAKMAAVLGAF